MITECITLDVKDAKTYPKKHESDPMRRQCKGNKSFDCADPTKNVITGYDSPTWVDYPPNTFHVRHITNMLHVLCGQRPVPANRSCLWGFNPIINEIATRCKVKITSGIDVHNIDDPRYIEGINRTQKTQIDSFNPNKIPIYLNNELKLLVCPNDIDWTKLRWWMGGKPYDIFGVFCDEILGKGIFGVIGFIKVLEMLNLKRDSISNHPIWKSTYQDNEISPPKLVLKKMFREIIIEGNVIGQYFFRSFSKEKEAVRHICIPLLNYGISKISCVDGKIYVPVSEIELDLFNKGTGFATLLDGGHVKLEAISSISNLLLRDSIPVFGAI